MDIDPVIDRPDETDLQPSTRVMPLAPPTDKVVTPTVEDDETDKAIAPSVNVHSTTKTDDQQTFDIPASALTRVLQTDPVIYGISADEFYTIQQLYVSTPLPNDILFPWLHGVNGRSYQQNLFFGVRRSIVPQHRGLTLVHADESCPYSARLSQAVLPSELLTQQEDGVAFINTSETDHTINLRNFKIQVSRYGSISDVVVYGYGAHQVAQKVAEAQARLRRERLEHLEQIRKTAGSSAVKDANDLSYRVLVITDPFTTIEERYPELVSYDSNGVCINTVSFWEREREEMRVMSGATEITPNVWVGNTQDAPASIRQSDIDDDESESDDNPHQFSICIEAHDLADMPLPSTLTLARETLNELPTDGLPPEIIHLDVHSTGVPMELQAFDKFYDRLIHLLAFVDDQANRGRNILIHCSDGYTETSLMVLSWIMYKEKVRLPEAYLILQRKRSFFVYAVDVPTLRRIEHHLGQQPSDHHKRKRERDLMDEDDVRLPPDTRQNVKDLHVGCNDMDEIEDDEDDEDDDDEDDEMHVKDNRLLHDDIYINNISNQVQPKDQQDNVCFTPPVPGRPVRAGDYQPLDDIDETIPAQLLAPEPDATEKMVFPWFYSPRFEGSFPSRILPFLYLGNLNHATNPEMLKALGITHVVSVGEDANLDRSQFNLLFLDNLYDDGIDSIRSRLEETMRFVDEAYAQNSHCLIHCRVGVSRSAAITICYVMHHLKFTLVQAYLYVRARRLNVIIQPNLKFMYEMLQLEQHLLGKATITWPILSKEIHLLNMSYRES
ncbi:protein-tyrosine phosphatase-like protein [Fennellomyces sp. T-0311]|nr:protein-tyrosine phosphatase-like protein [Fennellomyces sp. T-0311]